MTMKWLMLGLLSLCYICEARNKIIIVAMSGLRHDFIDLPNLDTLTMMKDTGFYAKKMSVSFISNSFPTLWTIATGLWPEQHGILDDNMWDPDMSAPFHGDADAITKGWFVSEPLWITAEKQNIRTAVSGWPGSSMKKDGYRALHHSYVERESRQHTMNRILEFSDWMATEADLGFFLFPQPDNAAHSNGTEGPHIKQAMKENDGQLAYLIKALKEFGVYDQTNIIVVGDHGIANHMSDQVIYLNNYGVRLQHISWVTNTLFTSGMLTPHEEYLEQVYHNLSRINPSIMKVYKREDIPEHYHIKNNRRCTPLLLVPAVGYRIELIEPHVLKTYEERVVGMHGYDNRDDSMKSLMVAIGPDFDKNVVETFDSKDIYPLVCSLLKLNKCHGSPGSLKNAKQAVKDKADLREVRGPEVNYFEESLNYQRLSGSSSADLRTSLLLVSLSAVLSFITL